MLALGCHDDAIERVGPNPNLVLIVVDTLRADAIRGTDGDVWPPAMRSLAHDGVVFEQCYSHASMTLPSHVSLFSSRFPFETHVYTNEDRVPEDVPLLAEHLGNRGYATGAAVSIGSLFGLRRGFADYRRRGVVGLTYAEVGFPMVSETLQALESRSPFFLFAHFSDPHDPYRAHGTIERNAEISIDGQPVDTVSTTMADIWVESFDLPPGERRVELRSDAAFSIRFFRATTGEGKLAHTFEEGGLARTGNRAVVVFDVPGDAPTKVGLRIWVADHTYGEERLGRYSLEVGYVDRFIGELLNDLRARGLYDDALIVLTADHGEGLGQHDWWVHAENVYDEQLRVPLIVKPPAGFDLDRLRRNATRLVRHVDVLPTCLEIMGVPPLTGARGHSLLDRADRLQLAQTHRPIASRNLVCARDEHFKLILDADTGAFEMYDIVSDPGETVDVFAERGAERAEWQSMLTAIAAISSASRTSGVEIDDEMRAQLDALGY